MNKASCRYMKEFQAKPILPKSLSFNERAKVTRENVRITKKSKAKRMKVKVGNLPWLGLTHG